jgi:hypothetical protein
MVGELLALAHALAWLSYVLGVLLQTLPIPRKSVKAWGPTLMLDAVIAELSLATISIVESLIRWLSTMISSSLGSPLNPLASFSLIVGELTALDATFLAIIALVSSQPETLPFLPLLNNIMNPALTIVTAALITWIIIQTIASFLPSIWLSTYVLGLVFYAIPFRIGRRLGSYLIASSTVLAIALPIMPSLAISLQSLLGYKLLIEPLQDAVSTFNPLAIINLLSILSTTISRILAAIIISLIIFPPVYFFILSALIRGVANAIGGAASGPTVQSFTIIPAWELAGGLTR